MAHTPLRKSTTCSPINYKSFDSSSEVLTDTMDISKEPTGMESSIWQWLRAEKVMVYSRNN